MRLLTIALLALGSLGAFGMPPSQAQVPNYPWCITYIGPDADGGVHCMFTSYAQCMMTATPGSGGTCTPSGRNNPRLPR
jgi:hypothetical protein